MSIDPRVMKTLLQLQWMPSLDLTGDSAGTDSASGMDSLFGTVLSQLMGGTTDPMGSLLGDEQQLPDDSIGSLLPAFNQLAPFYSGMSDSGSLDSEPSASDYDDYINQASIQFGVEPSLVKAVIDSESSFNPGAVSSAGAKGLMQLMDGTARSLGVTDSFDPRQNIEGGTRFLSYLLDKYNGNVGTALAAYNAGPGRVDRAGISNDAELTQKLALLPAETRHYVDKVLSAKDKYTGAV